jgi:hypothetical protein
MKSHTIELLMQFIASSHLSFRQAGGWPLWNVIHSAIELAQAACAGRPRAKPDDLLPQMDRKAVAREFTAAADTQFGGAASAFRVAHLVAIILDAVTTWGRQLLPSP